MRCAGIGQSTDMHSSTEGCTLSTWIRVLHRIMCAPVAAGGTVAQSGSTSHHGFCSHWRLYLCRGAAAVKNNPLRGWRWFRATSLWLTQTMCVRPEGEGIDGVGGVVTRHVCISDWGKKNKLELIGPVVDSRRVMDKHVWRWFWTANHGYCNVAHLQ